MPPEECPDPYENTSLESFEQMLPQINKGDLVWSLSHRQIELFVDNHPLALMNNGKAFYRGESINFDLINSTIDQVETICSCGWLPRCSVLNVAIWRRRCWNVLADRAANIAIARESDWSLTHLEFHSDGAHKSTTKRGASAFSITLSTLGPDGSLQRELIHISATFLRNSLSAFHAESLAVNQALRFLNSHL